MIYITRDERNPDQFIEYHAVLSKKKFKKRDGFVKLKLWDPITEKYRKQIVYIVDDRIEFSDKDYIYKITKVEEK